MNNVVSQVLKILVLCLVVGVVLSALSIDALSFVRFISQSIHNAADLIVTAVQWSIEYVLLGAVIVVPIYLIKLGMSYFKRKGS